MVRAAAKHLAIRTDGQTKIQNWVLLGLDLSLSRTGYATLFIEGPKATWGRVGSYSMSEDNKGEETWARAQAYAMGIGSELLNIWEKCRATGKAWGLGIIMEYPDPDNSYLMGLNQVIQTSLWNAGIPCYADFLELRRMFVNASTLRSVMGILSGTGKAENQRIAQTFLPEGVYARLDQDACDAVLLCMYARWGIQMLHGNFEGVPLKAQASLAKDDIKVKVKHRKDGSELSRKETPSGVLYDPALWTKIILPRTLTMRHADSARAKAATTPITLHL